MYLIPVILVILSSGANAAAKSETCQNSKEMAKIFADARDNGMSFDKMTSNIEKLSRSNGSSEEDVVSVKIIARSIYTDKKEMTPDQIGRIYYANCIKYIK